MNIVTTISFPCRSISTLATAPSRSLRFNLLAQLEVIMQSFQVMLLIIPFGLPAAYDANPETVGVYFMSHLFSLLGDENLDMRSTLQYGAEAAPGLRPVPFQRAGFVSHYINNL